MRYKRLAIAFSAILFAVIIFLSACLIFTVRNVSVSFACITEKTKNEILLEKEKLEGFVGQNVFFVNEEEVAGALAGNPYVKVLSVKVKLPARLSVTVEERLEYFSVCNEGRYFNLTKDNYVLCELAENQARLDGMPHAVINGDTVNPTVNTELVSDDDLFNVAVDVIKSFGDVRNEVVSVTIDRYNEESESSFNEWNRIVVKTKEGAIFTITEAVDLAEKKIMLLQSVYGLLEFEERTNASVVIFTAENSSVDYEISVG